MRSRTVRATVVALAILGCILSLVLGVVPMAASAQLSSGTASASFVIQLVGYLLAARLMAWTARGSESNSPASSASARLLLAFAATLAVPFLLWLPLPGTPGSDPLRWAIILGIGLAGVAAAVELRRRPRVAQVLAMILALYGVIVFARIVTGEAVPAVEDVRPGHVLAMALGSGAAAACLAAGIATLQFGRRPSRAADAGAT